MAKYIFHLCKPPLVIQNHDVHEVSQLLFMYPWKLHCVAQQHRQEKKKKNPNDVTLGSKSHTVNTVRVSDQTTDTEEDSPQHSTTAYDF